MPSRVVTQTDLQTDAPAMAAVHSASATLAYSNIFPATSPPPTAEDLTPGWVEMLSDPNGAVYVARQDEHIVGVVALTLKSDKNAELFLTRLYVHPDQWRQGFGAALHDHAVAEGFLRTATLYLWVLEQNATARRMYERRGWQLVPGRFLANDPPSVQDVLYRLDRDDTG